MSVPVSIISTAILCPSVIDHFERSGVQNVKGLVTVIKIIFVAAQNLLAMNLLKCGGVGVLHDSLVDKNVLVVLCISAGHMFEGAWIGRRDDVATPINVVFIPGVFPRFELLETGGFGLLDGLDLASIPFVPENECPLAMLIFVPLRTSGEQQRDCAQPNPGFN